MFEKKTRLRVKCLLEKQFDNFCELEQTLKANQIDRQLRSSKSQGEKDSQNRSTNERNMTRKTRTRQPRIHSVFQSGYCAVCHTPYSNLEDHIQSKRHLKLIGDDGSFISIKGFDTFLALDGIDSVEVNERNCDYSPPRRSTRMPRTRAASVLGDRIKDSPMSPVGSDTGHHLRSRKNINYMTPPLEEDSLTEKPEVVKEYRELRSSSRLLAKLADHMVENEEVWNSGRPKRSCNRTRISADERLVVDNKSYYKVEVLPTKLRSGVAPFHHPALKRPETPFEKYDDKGLVVKFKKMRNSELVRLNNEAENFLFPKKDETSDEEDDDQSKNDNSSVCEPDDVRKIKMEDDESMHSTSSESKGKKRRRTHAEAFIMDNQKYYKFETPGSRLRYQGSYLSPVPMKLKNNGDCVVKNDECSDKGKDFKLSLNDYKFSFESIPKAEAWYQTFQRRDKGEEKYVFLSDDNYWDPLILPYQLKYIPPLDPRECLSTYNQIKKCLMEPPSASTSVTCSTPDPNASNSSVETLNQDEDSKISATEVSSNSTIDDVKLSPNRKSRRSAVVVPVTGNGKNPRKSPRQHASTLAILSLLQQRKRKSRRGDLDFRTNLPTILEEPKQSSKSGKKSKVDYFSIMKNVEEEFASVCDENLADVDIERNEDIELKGKMDITEILDVYEDKDMIKTAKKVVGAKPGRKPGKRKKNRTGWPLNRSRRLRKKEDDESTVDSASVNADSEAEDTTDSIKKKEVEKSNSENNNQNDQSSLSDVNIADSNCDLNADRVGKDENKSDDANSVLNKVSDGFNIDLQYQPYVRVQKLDKNHIDNKNEKRSSSPKRTNRGQRRMPASPKSPRMLRRPRGRWYRER